MTEIELSPNTPKFVFLKDKNRFMFFIKQLLPKSKIDCKVVDEYDLYTYEEIYSNNVLVGYAFVFEDTNNILNTSNMIIATESEDFNFTDKAIITKATYFLTVREVNNLVIIGGDKK